MDAPENETFSLEEVAFSAVLPAGVRLPEKSLLDLSGDLSLVHPTFDSGLTRRVAKAWTTPARELSGAEVSMLVGQKFGLTWLAKPVLSFLREKPAVECRFYPGDLSFVALQAHKELFAEAPDETRAWLSASFDWMNAAYAFDNSLMREASTLLAQARAAVG